MDGRKRALSYVIVTLIYIAATAIGLIVAYLLSFPFWLNLLIADVCATVVVFLFSLSFSNASVYDPYWSVAPIVIMIGYSVIAKGWNLTMIFAVVAVLLWGVRLTVNWAVRFRGLDEKFQDWRYTLLKERTGKWYFFVNLFGVHLVPTLIVYLCVLPAVSVLVYAPAFNIWCAVCFAVAVLAILLEGAADCSMQKFKREGGEGFCRRGLWKYSRHPNYLGEILFWWAIGAFSVCVLPKYWWLLAGAIVNTLLFLLVSVRLADEHQSRKEGFALYKKNTRMFLPLWKRQHEEPEENPETTEEAPETSPEAAEESDVNSPEAAESADGTNEETPETAPEAAESADGTNDQTAPETTEEVQETAPETTEEAQPAPEASDETLK